jgi:hypothetical protein
MRPAFLGQSSPVSVLSLPSRSGAAEADYHPAHSVRLRSHTALRMTTSTVQSLTSVTASSFDTARPPAHAPRPVFLSGSRLLLNARDAIANEISMLFK